MAELCHRGRLLHTTTLYRERTREIFFQKLWGGQVPNRNYVQKMGGPATTQPSPPTEWWRLTAPGEEVVQVYSELWNCHPLPSSHIPSSPPSPPHLFQDQPHFHRRSVCPGQRLDTSLETSTTKVKVRGHQLTKGVYIFWRGAPEEKQKKVNIINLFPVSKSEISTISYHLSSIPWVKTRQLPWEHHY